MAIGSQKLLDSVNEEGVRRPLDLLPGDREVVDLLSRVRVEK